MLNYLLIRHKVKDFTSWKRVYDTHLPKRNEATLREKYLFRGVSDPNEVIILFEATNLDLAKKFIESADLRETMEKAGVIDEPDIYFLNEEKAGVRTMAA